MNCHIKSILIFKYASNTVEKFPHEFLINSAVTAFNSAFLCGHFLFNMYVACSVEIFITWLTEIFSSGNLVTLSITLRGRTTIGNHEPTYE